VKPTGEFVARGLIPGDYAVQAVFPSPGQPDDTREREMGSVAFRIDRADLDGLVVTTRKAARLLGRVTFDDATPPAGAGSVRILAVPDRRARGMAMGPQPAAQVGSDLTFELPGLFAPSSLLVGNTPRDWIVKEIRYRGQDVADLLVDFSSARPDETIEIVLTARGARLSGQVVDEQGQPAETAQVFVLPVDPARWPTASASRVVFVKPDGSFQAGPLRAGEYLIAAVADPSLPPGLTDPDVLERVARIAQRVTLAEGDQQTLDLRVRPLR
jgi:hypothetical protein